MKNIKLSAKLSTIISWTITAIIILAVLSLPFLYVYCTQRNHEITVKKTERIVSPDGKSSKYLIYAEDGVYENTDNVFRMKFNSADVYNQLQNGKTYMCDTYGSRVPFLSIYPNIVKCEEK
nr:MAG TPA: Protein of unknown function (DUF1523) [Caudoviricetes sp.]